MCRGKKKMDSKDSQWSELQCCVDKSDLKAPRLYDGVSFRESVQVFSFRDNAAGAERHTVG